jgi:hypothetical protein
MPALTQAENIAAVQQPHVPYVLFVSLDFVSGVTRLSSWDKDFSFGGFTYNGIGNTGLGSVSETKDEGAMKAGSLDLTLRGVPTVLTKTISDGSEKYFGRSVAIYMGWLNATYELVGTPENIWNGLMDSIVMVDDAGTSDIIVTCENELNILTRNIGLQFTTEHQAFIDATDTFFSQVPSLQTKQVNWGGRTV